MAERNQHGLGRYVPNDVRAAVRQRCGFGCVICGAAWYDYEHFAPDFKDAKIHDPSGITLLCMQHNQRRARGTLSVESVRNADANPFCRQQGFSSETFDFGTEPLEVMFASAKFSDCAILVAINDYPIFSIRPPEQTGQPYLVSGLFSDRDGQVTLRLEDNVFKVGADNWDVECKGPRITVKRSKDDIALVIKSEPPNRIIVEKIHMEFEGAVIKGDVSGMEISSDGVSFTKLGTCDISGARTGMAIKNR